MLSTEQKKLRDEANLLAKNNISAKASSLGIVVRLMQNKSDLSRVTELWANLVMIQELRGQAVWREAAELANEDWASYISKLIHKANTRIFVFENSEAIFGFAFARLHKLEIQGQTHLKATLEELYLEPAFRDSATKEAMAIMLREALKTTGVEFIEFAIQDLPQL